MTTASRRISGLGEASYVSSTGCSSVPAGRDWRAAAFAGATNDFAGSQAIGALATPRIWMLIFFERCPLRGAKSLRFYLGPVAAPGRLVCRSLGNGAAAADRPGDCPQPAISPWPLLATAPAIRHTTGQVPQRLRDARMWMVRV